MVSPQKPIPDFHRELVNGVTYEKGAFCCLGDTSDPTTAGDSVARPSPGAPARHKRMFGQIGEIRIEPRWSSFVMLSDCRAQPLRPCSGGHNLSPSDIRRLAACARSTWALLA